MAVNAADILRRSDVCMANGRWFQGVPTRLYHHYYRPQLHSTEQLQIEQPLVTFTMHSFSFTIVCVPTPGSTEVR